MVHSSEWVALLLIPGSTCLSHGCSYPDEVMHEVRGLAARVGELEDYRRDKKEKESNRIKFVKGGKN